MKDPAANIAIAADRTALANAATPVIRLFNLFQVAGHVVLTRPRPAPHFSLTGKKAERATRVRGRLLSRKLEPAALDLVSPSNQRRGAYVTSHR